jgi:hypothetical protein
MASLIYSFFFVCIYIDCRHQGETHSNHIKTRIHHHFSFFHRYAYSYSSIEQSYILLGIYIYNCVLTVVSIFSFLLMFYSVSIGLFSIYNEYLRIFPLSAIITDQGYMYKQTMSCVIIDCKV